jgi:hypothetical protein
MAIEIGSIVLVEEAWEDEAGDYHDEFAEVVSLDPLKLKFMNEDPYTNECCESQDWTIEDLQE